MGINLPCGNKPLTTNECGGDCDEKIERLAERVSEAEEKLDTIQEGAEVNVNADWEETDPNSDAYIENKPSVNYDLSLGDSAPTVGSAVVGSAVLGSLVDIILGRGDGTEDRVSVSGTGAIQITRDGDTMTIHVPVGEIDQLRNGTDTEARAWAASVLKQWLDERIAQIPADQFLDLNKTVFANPFTWSSSTYPGSINPNLDGKPVLVLALTDGENVSYSFLNMEDLIDAYEGVAPISVNGSQISHDNSGVTAGSYGDSSNQTPNFGDTFKALRSTVDAKGHVTSMSEHTVKIPDTLATQESAGLMSAEDKEKLDNVDQLYKTTCGNPIVIDDADGEVKSLNVELTPIQDLHGYDKPWAAGAGKNKLLIETNTETVGGITFTQNADGSIVANGTATEAVVYNVKPLGTASYSMLSDIWDIKADTQYILSGVPTGYGYPNCYLQLLVYGSGAEPYDGGSGSTPFSFTQEVIDTKRYRLAIRVASGYTLNNVVFKPMIRLATETDSSWTPYENICPIYPHTSLPVRDTGVNQWGGLTMANNIHDAVGNESASWLGTDTYGDFVTIVASSPANNKTVFKTAFKPNTRYTLIVCGKKNNTNTSFNMGIWYTDGTISYVSAPSVTADTVTTFVIVSVANKTIDHISTLWASGTAYLYYNECGLFEGVLTASDFAPYTGQTVTVPLNDLYGGNVDVIGGQSETGWANIPSYNGETISEPWLSSMDEYVQGATPTTGAQVTYKLATPTPLTTTPTPLTLYKGDNVVSSDGDVCITYLQDRGDLTDFINEMKACCEEVKGSLLENLVDGTAQGSLRGIDTAQEDANYTLGTDATALGNGTKASGDYSVAEGTQTEASGLHSHAEGVQTKAMQQAAHAEGAATTANALFAHSEGNATNATGRNAHAEGGGTTASEDSAHAEGGGTVASARNAHAEGGGTVASARNAHAEGNGTKAVSMSQHVGGEFNELDPTGSATTRGTYVEIIGNGASDTARSNARTLDWNGNEALQGGLTLGKGTADEVTITAAQLQQLLTLI